MDRLKLLLMLGSALSMWSCWEDFANNVNKKDDKGKNNQKQNSNKNQKNSNKNKKNSIGTTGQQLTPENLNQQSGTFNPAPPMPTFEIKDDTLISEIFKEENLKQFFQTPPTTSDLLEVKYLLDFNVDGTWCNLSIFFHFLKHFDSFLSDDEKFAGKVTVGNLKHLLKQNVNPVEEKAWDVSNLVLSEEVISENDTFRLRKREHDSTDENVMKVLDAWTQLFWGEGWIFVNRNKEFFVPVIAKNAGVFPVEVTPKQFIPTCKRRLGLPDNSSDEDEINED